MTLIDLLRMEEDSITEERVEEIEQRISLLEEQGNKRRPIESMLKKYAFSIGIAAFVFVNGFYCRYTPVELRAARHEIARLSSDVLKTKRHLSALNVEVGVLSERIYKDTVQIPYYTRAIELNPSNKNAYRELGSAYLRSGNYKKAEEYLKKALGIDPNYGPALNDLGFTHIYLGKYEEAEKEFKKRLENEPCASITHENLGYFYQVTGRLDEAEPEYRMALSCDPENQSARTNLENLLKQKNGHI